VLQFTITVTGKGVLIDIIIFFLSQVLVKLELASHLELTKIQF
jgi:hypothetical protein